MSKNIIIDIAALNTAIDGWAQRGKKWTADGQILGLSALTRLKDHGDIGPVNRLFAAMPKGTKSGSMAEWLLKYGALRANDDKGTKAEKAFLYDKERTTDLVGAAAEQWVECGKPEQAPDAIFDVQAAFFAFMKKVEKDSGKAGEVKHPELMDQLKEMAASLAASAEANGTSGTAVGTL